MTSKTISFLRFPLTLLVVFIHASLTIVPEVTAEQNPIATRVCYLFCDLLGNLAVPTFFLISGYLFFAKVEEFGLDTYKDKLEKRAHSLLTPYIAWNVFYLLLIFACQLILPQMMSGSNKAVVDYSVTDFLFSFVSMDYVNDGFSFRTFELGPIDLPLWYVRDLMLLALYSPLIFWSVKKLRVLPVVLLFVLWCSGLSTHLLCVHTVDFFFFTMGAYMSVNKKDLVGVIIPFGRYFVAAFLFMLVAFLVSEPVEGGFKNTYLLVGVVAILYLGCLLVDVYKVRIPEVLGKSSFFVYAFHFYFMIAAMRIAGKIFAHNDVLMSVVYLLLPLLVYSIIVALYVVLDRLMPKLLALFTGGR